MPVVACFMTEDELPTRTLPGKNPIPVFPFPESAATALGHAAKYAYWKTQPLGALPDFGAGFAPARNICRQFLTDHGPGWLSAADVRTLLQSAGFLVPKGGLARTADQAVQFAADIGYPVALKLASRTIVHKSDVGGVRLHLTDAAAVQSAFAQIRSAVPPEGFDGVLVQPMVRDAVEVVLGMSHDPSFGPLVMFGLGGIHVEVLADVCFRITPVTDRDAAEMVRSIRGYRLLQGYRGHPRCDISALEQLILRLSGLVEAVPEIAELDLNPVMALAEGHGYAIVDARIAVV
jgi:acyl-CoA synthetase (NDP forming)